MQERWMSQQIDFFTRTPSGGGATTMFVRAGDAAWMGEHPRQPFDAVRVAYLRAAIVAGTYRMDPFAVADGLLAVERLLDAHQRRQAPRRRSLRTLAAR
jgi:hypothetical protein